MDDTQDQLTVMELVGQRGRLQLESEQGATSTLSISLTGLGDDLQVSRALFRILKRGLEPNLVFDRERFAEKLQRVTESIDPVVVHVSVGEVIIEPGTQINREQLEMLDAYREALTQGEEIISGFNLSLAKRMILTFVLLCCAALYWQVAFERRPHNYQRLGMGALVILLNLALLRLVDSAGDIQVLELSSDLLESLPFAAPLALGAIVLGIMLGPRPAVLAAVIISTLFGIMRGNSMTLFLIAFLSCLVGIACSYNVRQRGLVVRAGMAAGLTVAAAAIFTGLANEIPVEIFMKQAVAGFVSGLISGIVAIGLLPLLEQLFHYTTDITLLELTDFNHPLLRKLQVVAPGTYHHSLMVANLSERAASQINANATLCRAACLFHDIGKMVKPDFFVENQHQGNNPHDKLKPSMSALIIKNHVKEGLQMAREAKLPKPVLEIIAEHHGTTLIKFFYVKALERQKQPVLDLAADQTKRTQPPMDVSTGIDESAFRYDGPRPQSRESAIIFLADAVEAASRSLKKVTPQAIEDLVESLVKGRMDDGQFDECALTLSELSIVSESMCHTVQNMLHSRIEYPKLAEAGSRAPMAMPANLPSPPAESTRAAT